MHCIRTISVPHHISFSKREKPFKKYVPKKISRFIREHTNCGDIVPYSRFLLTVNKKHGERILKEWHRWYWAIRLKFIRKFRSGLIPMDNNFVIQPLISPLGPILTIKVNYKEKES